MDSPIIRDSFRSEQTRIIDVSIFECKFKNSTGFLQKYKVMPQEIHVVQCYSCHMYQVDIVKKSNKWACKLCGEKQTLQHVFGKGSGKECRLHVQKLNDMKRINDENYVIPDTNRIQEMIPAVDERKWAQFVESNDEESDLDTMEYGVTHHRSIRQDKSFDCSSANGNLQSFKNFIQDSPWSASIHTEDKSLGNVSFKEKTSSNSLMLTATVSKKQKVDKNTSNAKSKWFQFLSDESDDEEDDQSFNVPESTLSGTKQKDIFGNNNVSIDDLFADP